MNRNGTKYLVQNYHSNDGLLLTLSFMYIMSFFGDCYIIVQQITLSVIKFVPVNLKDIYIICEGQYCILISIKLFVQMFSPLLMMKYIAIN